MKIQGCLSSLCIFILHSLCLNYIWKTWFWTFWTVFPVYWVQHYLLYLGVYFQFVYHIELQLFHSMKKLNHWNCDLDYFACCEHKCTLLPFANFYFHLEDNSNFFISCRWRRESRRTRIACRGIIINVGLASISRLITKQVFQLQEWFQHQ